MRMLNRLANARNQFQGPHKRVLCVCSAGMLRSPTAAVVLSAPPFNYNTRAAGFVSEYALIPVDDVLLTWADEVVCMEPDHATEIGERLKDTKKNVICLDIEDCYEYRHPDLMKMIAERYSQMLGAIEVENAKAT